MVLWNFVRDSRCLFLPGKTRRTSKFQLRNVKTTRLPHKLAQLSSILSMHDGHNSIERYAVAIVAYAPNRHKGPSYGGYLEN